MTDSKRPVCVVRSCDDDSELIRQHGRRDAKLPLSPSVDTLGNLRVLEPLSRIKLFIQDYSVNTTLHGLKYVGEPGRSWFERVFWAVMVVMCVIVCGILIRKVWNKWDESPVIVSFAETTTPVWRVPFPAITICSETKARQSEYNFTHYYHEHLKKNLTEEELKMHEDVSLVCDQHLLTEGRDFTDFTTVNNLMKVAPQFSEMMFHCKYRNKPGNCSQLFSPMLTEEGLCFTFNTLDAKEMFRTENLQEDYHYLNHSQGSSGWTLDNGYPAEASIDTYPIRGTGYGAKTGITVVLRAYNHDLDYICRGPVQGFKVLLHNPAEVPRLSQQYFRVPLSQEVVAAVKPNMMSTSEGLKQYDPHRRQCYFQAERHLRYFQIYTQQNCELECLTNYTLARCGCVQFSMPRDDSMPICSSGNTNCSSDAQMELVTREIATGLGRNSKISNEAKRAENVAIQCDCLPACTSIEYDAETSQADFNWRKLMTAYKVNTSDMVGWELSRVFIFFKEAQFITSRRSELYGQTDFLANCGGLLGLFMGFSLLSVVEIIYFLTLRIWTNIAKRVKTKASYIQENMECPAELTCTDKINLYD